MDTFFTTELSDCKIVSMRRLDGEKRKNYVYTDRDVCFICAIYLSFPCKSSWECAIYNWQKSALWCRMDYMRSNFFFLPMEYHFEILTLTVKRWNKIFLSCKIRLLMVHYRKKLYLRVNLCWIDLSRSDFRSKNISYSIYVQIFIGIFLKWWIFFFVR